MAHPRGSARLRPLCLPRRRGPGRSLRLGCTLNEPGIYAAFAYILGRWPGETGLLPFIRVSRNQLRAHAAAYHAVKAVQPHARVGLVQHFAGFEPADPGSRRDRLVAAIRDSALNWRMIEAVVTGRLKPPYGLGLGR